MCKKNGLIVGIKIEANAKELGKIPKFSRFKEM
jgi:hypothetical protein